MSRNLYLWILWIGAGTIAVAGLVSALIVDPLLHLPSATGYGYGALDPSGWAAVVRNCVIYLVVASIGVAVANALAPHRPPALHLSDSLSRSVALLVTALGWVAMTSVVAIFGVGSTLYFVLEEAGTAPPTGGSAPTSVALYLGGGVVLLVGFVAAIVATILDSRIPRPSRRSHELGDPAA